MTAAACRGEHTESFFDDSCCIEKGFCQLRVFLKHEYGFLEVLAKDFVVLGAYEGQCGGVDERQMQNMTNGAACGVVACENEESDLARGESTKFGIQLFLLRLRVLWYIGLKNEIDDGFASDFFGISSVFGVSPIQLFSYISIHFSAIPPIHIPSGDIKILKRIGFRVRLIPSILAQHTVDQVVDTSLGVKRLVNIPD